MKQHKLTTVLSVTEVRREASERRSAATVWTKCETSKVRFVEGMNWK